MDFPESNSRPASGGPRLLGAGAIVLLAMGCSREPAGFPEDFLPAAGWYWGRGVSAALTAPDSARDFLVSLPKAILTKSIPPMLEFRYPRSGVVFPPEFIPPTFQWTDSSPADFWWIEFSPNPGPSLHALTASPPAPPPEIDSQAIPANLPMEIPDPNRFRNWTPAVSVWETMKRESRESWAALTITGFSRERPHHPLSRGQIRFKTSRDSVGAPVFYRDVPLLPNRNKSGRIQPLDEPAMRLIRWSLRDVSLPRGKPLISSLPTCANCHSFSNDGRYIGMDLDGPQNDKGTYGVARLEEETDIARSGVFSWNRDFKRKRQGKSTIGFLSRLSPDGRYVATTVQEEVVVHNYLNPRYIQVFYPTRGVLAIRYREGGAIRLLPGADDTAYVHCNPAWSPDGKYIVFSRARAKDPYWNGQTAPDYPNDPNETQIQYDLYRIPFNGGRGGQAEPIPGASGTGFSHTFPKVTPDGKYIVFVKCRNGQLLRPDGRLMIIPFTGGTPRVMECNLTEMNSWHSFSPNGRWMVFASKGFSHYTQLFLTHIDEDGNDSPPVLIPNATADNRAANIPEFVNFPYAKLRSVSISALRHMQYLQDANLLLEQNKLAEAREKMRQALGVDAGDPQFTSEVRVLLAWLQDSLPDRVRMTRAAIQADPENVQAHLNMATLLSKQGRDREALESFAAASRLDPANPWPLLGLVRIRMQSAVPGLKDASQAVELAERANRVAKFREPSILKSLARAYSDVGRFREALEAAGQGLALARQQGLHEEVENLANDILFYENGQSFSQALEQSAR